MQSIISWRLTVSIEIHPKYRWKIRYLPLLSTRGKSQSAVNPPRTRKTPPSTELPEQTGYALLKSSRSTSYYFHLAFIFRELAAVCLTPVEWRTYIPTLPKYRSHDGRWRFWMILSSLSKEHIEKTMIDQDTLWCSGSIMRVTILMMVKSSLSCPSGPASYWM